MQHVYIVGSKGIPGHYGGYETFLDKLTEYHQYSNEIKYHVACKGDENKESTYHNARCITVKVPHIGSAQAIYYDVVALQRCCKYIKKNNIETPIVYVLACRIGPLAGYFARKIHKLGGALFVNPDGHEWKRAKWNALICKYWKASEKMMVKHADLLICDSMNIEKYIKNSYKKYHPNTRFIAYGSKTTPSKLNDHSEIFIQWLKSKGLEQKNYYLVVGRFVPENNFETMLREFMKSKSNRDFAIITTANDAFMEKLERKLHFGNDRRIKFVGTVYNQELLKKIRENAYGYLHGHEVGGTNPSLLESLGSTDLNLLLDVGFNREVAQNAAIYWSKEDGNLAELIDRADIMDAEIIAYLGVSAKKRIDTAYSWEYICGKYKEVFNK